MVDDARHHGRSVDRPVSPQREERAWELLQLLIVAGQDLHEIPADARYAHERRSAMECLEEARELVHELLREHPSNSGE